MLMDFSMKKRIGNIAMVMIEDSTQKLKIISSLLVIVSAIIAIRNLCLFSSKVLISMYLIRPQMITKIFLMHDILHAPCILP